MTEWCPLSFSGTALLEYVLLCMFSHLKVPSYLWKLRVFLNFPLVFNPRLYFNQIITYFKFSVNLFVLTGHLFGETIFTIKSTKDLISMIY